MSPKLQAKRIIEGLLFASPEVLDEKKLKECLPEFDYNLENVLEELNAEYSEKAFYIAEVAGGYQMRSREAYFLYLQRLFEKNARPKLSRAALEALSVIAYRQPVTRAEVEDLRGVNSQGIIKSLMEKGLVTISGRDDGPGNALLYSTSQEFLLAFGLQSLNDMPKLKELQAILEDKKQATNNASE